MSLNQNLNGLNPLSYMGVNSPAPVNLTVRNQDPTATDIKNFERGALWLNPNNNRMYQLISLSGGVATWEGITYFVTRSVDPTSDDATYALGTLWLNTVSKDVFMLIETAGTPPETATWVLFMDASGPLLQITTDDATIVLPSAGNINLHGTNNITTTGSGSTATVSLTGTTNHTLQVGNASGGLTSLAPALSGQIPIGVTGGNPVLAAINSGTGILVANGAGSITVSITGTGVVSTLTGNSGGALSPTANNLNTVGSGNISIAGSGSTLTTTLVGTTNHSIQVGNASGSLTSLTAALDGEIPIGSTGANPTVTTITSGLNLSVVNGAGSITIGETTTPVLNNYTLVNTSPYVVSGTDYYLGVDSSGAPITIQLPNAPTANRTFVIKDISGSAGANNITVTTVGGVVTIDGATTFVMSTNYQYINLAFVGTSYQIY